MAMLLDGRLVSLMIKDEVKATLEKLYSEHKIKAKLAIVIAGDDAASQIYVNSKSKACEYVGMESVVIRLSADVSTEEVVEKVKELASDSSINGVMVQLPLPKGVDSKAVLKAIPVEKDVDGLTENSQGASLVDEDCFISCTPKGIIELLKRYNIEFKGKHAVVVGRSNMVGKPLAIRLLKENCTVTICHSHTSDLKYFTSQADLLFVAVGKKHIITTDMVKEGAVVVDVGMNRVDGKLYGDVDFDNVSKVASYITPVPGGVGLMTVAMLIKNTEEACLKQNHIKDGI